jgi:hypothetical protein
MPGRNSCGREFSGVDWLMVGAVMIDHTAEAVTTLLRQVKQH